MKKEVEVFVVMLVTVVMFCSFASAISASMAYGSDNPLTIYPGETKDASFALQTPSDEQITVETLLEDDGGIASVVDKEHTLSSASSVAAGVRLTIPESASIGQEYLVKIRFKEINPEGGEGGMVGLTASSTLVNLPVKVIERPVEEEEEEGEGMSTGMIVFIVILIVIVIAVIYFVMKKKSAPVKK